MTRTKKKKVKIEETSTVKYEGAVTIQKVKNGKIISSRTTHNQGYSTLFKFLLSCLTAEPIFPLRPTYASPVRSTSGEPDNFVGSCEEIASRKLKTSVNGGNLEYYVEYRFFFQYHPDYIEGFDKINIYPYENGKHPENKEGEKPADYIDYLEMSVDVNKEETKVSDEDLLIIWQLKLKN